MVCISGPLIIDDGLVLHLDAASTRSYPGTGTVWTDLSGNYNNGTLVNGPTYSSTNKGVIVSDGIDDYVNTNFLLPLSNFTVSMWFKRVSSAYWNVMWAGEVWSNGSGYIAYLGSDTVLYFGLGGGSGFATTISQSNVPTLYTFTLSNAGYAEVYTNGVLKNAQIIPLSTVSPKTIKLSTRHSNDGAGFADLRSNMYYTFSVYDRVLTAVEVKRNFQASRGRYGV